MSKRGAKKKLRVDDIDKAVATLERAAEVIEKEDQEPSLLIPGFDPGATDDAEQEISDLWSALPGTQDFYIKIYKRKPLPIGVRGPEFKEVIEDTKSITDLEIAVRDLAKDKNWGPGEYEIHALKKSGDLGGRPSRLAKPAIITIDYEQKKPEQTPNPSQYTPPYEAVTSFIKTAKELFPQQQDPAKYLAEVFKTSIETARSFIPKAPENGSGQPSILDVIKSLKEMGALGKDTSKPLSIDDIIKLAPILIAGIKDLGIFNRKEEKKESMLEVITQLRASGLIKVAGEDKSDPMDTIGKVVEMMNTLSPLMRGEGETSPVIELIRTVGPHVPKIVEDFTNTINNVAEVARYKLAAQMDVRPDQLAPRIPEKKEPVPIPSGGTEVIPPPPTPSPPPPPPINEETTVVRNPLMQQIIDAIEKKDVEYFPRLKQILSTYVGLQALESLVNDQITPDVFCSTLSDATKEPALNTEKAKEYLVSFVNWCKGEIEKSLIIGRCTKCQDEVEFLSEDEWNSDTKKCDCGGDLERIQADTP